ncbi:MAG: DUF4345 domain-containing protein [Neomegalonema sp.]|nr:DUF4345 domain-containing protein [Neomegalonema sp.]
MTATIFERATLGVAGTTALAIGAAIALAPHSFYASYGISLGSDASLMSELRAPGLNLAALGALIVAGAVRASLTRLSAGLGALVFLAFAMGRGVSFMLDGAPAASILAAFAIEAVFGGLCLLVFRRHAERRIAPAHSG